MANSKKDFCIVSKMVLDLINGLTEEQFNNLLNGTADIRYIERGLDSEKKEKYNEILYKLSLEDDDLKRIEFIKENDYLKTKNKLVEFCKNFRIEIKAKDTIDTIIENIINYVNKNKESILYRYSKLESLELGIDEVAKKLEEIMDIEEAKKLILESKAVENKANLIKLSKKLNVFTDREATYDTIMETIIKSVVEAKIRSYTIRKKL